MSRPVRKRRDAVAVGALGGLLLALIGSCGTDEPQPRPSPSPTPTDSAPATPEPTEDPGPALMAGAPELPDATDTPQDAITGLVTPWDLAFLPSGAVLVTERDTARVQLLRDTGIGPLGGPGAEALAATTDPGGEGGLLGVVVSPQFEADRLVYLYLTAEGGENRVVRGELDSVAGTLGDLQDVVGGIPAAGNHNGGRMAFGPDGMLYIATGDASERGLSQDPASLAGKILRVTPDGAPAPGNPTEGSPVWSLGHRNVQGLGWDAEGRMFASEFGQNTWDELNLIEPGGNYGWPEAEGVAGVSGLIDPLFVWAPSEASPSGLTVTDDAVYVAALRGARLWVVPFEGGGFAEPRAVLVDELGRLRHVQLGPDGALWILTQNTDGRGRPRAGDDRVVRMLPP